MLHRMRQFNKLPRRYSNACPGLVSSASIRAGSFSQSTKHFMAIPAPRMLNIQALYRNEVLLNYPYPHLVQRMVDDAVLALQISPQGLLSNEHAPSPSGTHHVKRNLVSRWLVPKQQSCPCNPTLLLPTKNTQVIVA